jgi:DNA primase
MARYTRESVEKVRDAVDFVELVGARTELRKAGVRRYTGLCPFHEERTPSFGIDPIEKLYHCFGCGQGGDVFQFVRETEALDFPGAIELLAERYGVELEREAEDPRDAQKRVRRERLTALLERTAAWYVRMLWESDEARGAREYLLGRGLSEDALRTYRVGYAPSAWDKVLVGSRRAGYSEEEMHAAGLVQRNKEGRMYDRFRARITFPLCDIRGQVLGFGARATRDEERAKYLNSPEGEIFHKGGMVYGSDLARNAASKAGSVVLCEGYTDVIALHQAGFENAVCSMGTAVTDEQARRLWQLAPNVTLCLDSDTAGQAAALKAYAPLVAGHAGGRVYEVRVAVLPSGSDPADVVFGQGASVMQTLLDTAVPFERFQVERALEAASGLDAVGRDRVLQDVAVVIRTVPTGILRSELVELSASRLGVTPQLVEQTLAAAPEAAAPSVMPPRLPERERRPGGGGGRGGRGKFYDRGDAFVDPTGMTHSSGPVATNGAQGRLQRDEHAERTFLAYCVALPEEGEKRLGGADLSTLFLGPATRKAAEYLRGRLATPAADLPPDDEALARLVAEMVIRAGELDATPAKLELEWLQLTLTRLEREIAAARATGDGEKVRALSPEWQRTHDAIRHRLH